mmetsp:Transcript_12076/g.28621  ORF Transcript_12076/g.28621 Transcript_12076/m.28621 type:complete len:200 (+) Transcript_12076:105-704(+)
MFRAKTTTQKKASRTRSTQPRGSDGDRKKNRRACLRVGSTLAPSLPLVGCCRCCCGEIARSLFASAGRSVVASHLIQSRARFVSFRFASLRSVRALAALPGRHQRRDLGLCGFGGSAPRDLPGPRHEVRAREVPGGIGRSGGVPKVLPDGGSRRSLHAPEPHEVPDIASSSWMSEREADRRRERPDRRVRPVLLVRVLP